MATTIDDFYGGLAPEKDLVLPGQVSRGRDSGLLGHGDTPVDAVDQGAPERHSDLHPAQVARGVPRRDDGDARELYVQFRRGRTYVYFDVPPTAYAALLEAPSKGRYVNFEIKPYHRYRRV